MHTEKQNSLPSHFRGWLRNKWIWLAIILIAVLTVFWSEFLT